VQSRIPVTVVIPVFNGFAAAAQAVRSVQRQSVPPQEIIVVDDGSTDGDLEAAWRDDPSLRTPVPLRILRQTNGGPSRARNAGIAAATQPWIAFLDADDLWFPQRLAIQWAALHRFPQAVLCTANWMRPGAQASRETQNAPHCYASPQAVRRIVWLNRFQTSTVLVATAALQQAGLFDPEMDGFEDWDLWMRVAACGDHVHLAVPLVIYADTPGGVSKNTHRAYVRGRQRLLRYHNGEGNPAVARWVTTEVLVWHQLRFAFAFTRLGERQMAKECLLQAWRDGGTLITLGVGVWHLLPFLIRRRLGSGH